MTGEDFGGELEAPAPAPKTRAEIRADKFARGECRECDRPVAMKRNGQPAQLCPTHLTRDRKRKTAP